ncbi:zinc finger BED domain-containing protein 4 [Amia ocellicauda]|uniref:zinc finger BED domain-containing protein 4 n=1 Tax=Amia ocellicauda TaxID=2972642 RepID=UPI0034642DE4
MEDTGARGGMNPHEIIAFSSWKFAPLFIFKQEKGKNVTVQCKLCKPLEKFLSTSKSSTSNLKKHLERIHPNTCANYVSKISARKRHAESSEQSSHLPDTKKDCPIKVPREGAEERPVKQAKLQTSIKTVSQKKVNTLVFNFIVEDVQAFSLLEQPSFIKLIEGLQPGRTLMCQKTLLERIGWAFQSMKEKVTATLNGVSSVCSTADIWSAHGRNFFGVTCHWIDESSLERKSVALSCAPIQGSSTCDVIVAKLNEVHSTFSLQNKLRCTVTDNGSSFAKPFDEFAYREKKEMAVQTFEIIFEDVNEILESDIKELQFLLPPHQRCAANALGDIASEEVDRAMSSGVTRSLYRNAMEKCSALWIKTHNYTFASKALEDLANMDTVVRNAARWLHEYRAIQKIVLLSKEHLGEACESLGVDKFHSEDISLLQEYVEVLKPLAYSIDFIQGEKKCFLGYLLPTLLTLKTKLSERKPHVRFCAQLVDALIGAIDRRFEKLMSSRDAKVATVTIPKFRTWWLPLDQKVEVENMLVEAAVVEDMWRGGRDAKATCDSDSESEDNFFSFATSHKQANPTVEDEVKNYLQDTDKCISSLKKYPTVKHLFIKYNTTLLSSAPVERLFSHKGQILVPQHNCMNDEYFEQVLLLRYNRELGPFLLGDE